MALLIMVSFTAVPSPSRRGGEGGFPEGVGSVYRSQTALTPALSREEREEKA